jgi:pSer/pThr/pTyr-binding forkhead associated (FHA) protein
VNVRFVILSTPKPRTSVKRLPLLVGRADEAKLRVVQDFVSRRHCEFIERDGEVYVRDLKSTNGTLVDGQLIPPDVDTLVKSGSIVRVGGAKFRVEYGVPVTTSEVPELEPEASDTTEEQTVEHSAAPPMATAAPVASTKDPEPPVLEPAGDETVGPDAAEPPPPADSSDFGFLSAAEPPAHDAPDAGWPVSSDAPAPPDEGDLNDFFKSLS